MEGCSLNRDLKKIAERVLTSFRSPRGTNFAKDARFQLVIDRPELFSDLKFQYVLNRYFLVGSYSGKIYFLMRVQHSIYTINFLPKG